MNKLLNEIMCQIDTIHEDDKIYMKDEEVAYNVNGTKLVLSECLLNDNEIGMRYGSLGAFINNVMVLPYSTSVIAGYDETYICTLFW